MYLKGLCQNWSPKSGNRKKRDRRYPGEIMQCNQCTSRLGTFLFHRRIPQRCPLPRIPSRASYTSRSEPISHLGTSPMISSNVVLATTISLSLYLIIRIIQWNFRLIAYRQRMPFIPILFPPESLVRVVWPRKWQTYHFDWHLHSKAKPYQLLNSDIFAFVSLFGHDTIVVRDPDAYVQMRITEPEHYPKDLHQYRVVCRMIDDYDWQFR